MHHFLLELGLQHTRVTFIISMLSLSLVIIALLMHFILSLDAIILGIVVVMSILYYLLNINKQVNEWKQKSNSWRFILHEKVPQFRISILTIFHFQQFS